MYGIRESGSGRGLYDFAGIDVGVLDLLVLCLLLSQMLAVDCSWKSSVEQARVYWGERWPLSTSTVVVEVVVADEGPAPQRSRTVMVSFRQPVTHATLKRIYFPNTALSGDLAKFNLCSSTVYK